MRSLFSTFFLCLSGRLPPVFLKTGIAKQPSDVCKKNMGHIVQKQRYPPRNMLYTPKAYHQYYLSLFEILCHKPWFEIFSSSKLRQQYSKSSVDLI